jgi:hypothetical protein
MKNGNPYSFYTGDIFLAIDGLSLREYTLPNQGRYQFIPEDLGKKTLNKGLEIRKTGKFTIRATNFDDTIRGSLEVEVVNSLVKPGVATITILYPQPNSTVQQPNIMMSARSLDLPNSPAQIYINDVIVNETSSDAEGNINASLVGLREGNNTLEIVITSSTNEELGRSEKITFAYTPLGADLFKKITATPKTGLLLGDLVSFDVEVDPLVSSVSIYFDKGDHFPADKVSDGKFSRSTVMLTTGENVISVETTALGETRMYTGVLSLFVDQETLIHNVIFKLDPQSLKDLNMSWSVLGKQASFFEVKYGLVEEALDNTIEVNRTEIIFQNIDTTKPWFFQITPLFGTERTHGAASDIYKRVSPITGTTSPTPTTDTSPANT